MAFLNIKDKNTFGEISKKDDRKIMSNLKIGGSYLEDQIVTNVKGIIFVVFYLIIETNVVVRIEIIHFEYLRFANSSSANTSHFVT